MPARNSLNSIVLTICVFLCVFFAGTQRSFGQVLSPGKLSQAHSKLEGADNCSECHSRKGRVEPARCLNCHKALKKRVEFRKGLHRGLEETRCGSCHQDHQGRNFDMVVWPRGEKNFDHLKAGYLLREAHKKPKCRECHKPANQVVPLVLAFEPKRRKKTYLGLGRKCLSCHEDEHRKQLDNNCLACHTEKTFEGAERFDHNDADFILKGAHQDVDCVDCHKKPDRNPEMTYTGFSYESCGDCHESSHQSAMDIPEIGGLCSSCHQESSFTELIYDRSVHSPQRFPLVRGHKDTPCTSCHGEKADESPLTSCTSCHEDRHEGKFGTGCASCHAMGSWNARIRWRQQLSETRLQESLRLAIDKSTQERTSFHDRTNYALTGLHQVVPCKDCHAGANYESKYQNLEYTACAVCHEDEHQGQFKSATCEECHSTEGWSLTSYDSQRHQEAQMPLRGSHQSVACNACHTKERAKDKRFRFATSSCADCHEEMHGGQFQANVDEKHPARTCEECHTEESFATSHFDHELTEFPLRGTHEQTDCDSCHEGEGEAQIFRGTQSVCSNCHQDSHLGQFTVLGEPRECGSCHGFGSFSIDKFEHADKTREPLEGKHAETDCESCHQVVVLNDNRMTTLFRLNDPECAACHQPTHEAKTKSWGLGLASLAKKSGTTKLDDCESCHSSIDWGALATPASFDHAIVGYTLRGQHQGATCQGCHQGAGTLEKECSSCHEDRHNGAMGGQCAECHQESSWRATDIRDRHRETQLPLTGRHALTDCISCHGRERQGQFLGTPVTCIGCHASDYTSNLTHPNHVLAGFGQECQDCHRSLAWSPAYFRHASFRLRGAHVDVRCNGCHDGGPDPVSQCASCHTSSSTRFTSLHARSVQQDCDSCHGDTTWAPASYPAHETDSGFSITRGPHKGNDCSDCHLNSTDQVTCTSGCHTRGETANQHSDVRDYVYTTSACLGCHPDGRE